MCKLRNHICSAQTLTLAVYALSIVLVLSPLSLSPQDSFSLSLDVDETAGDQALTALAVSPGQVISIQIFGTDILNATSISARFECDATQVEYEGFEAGTALPDARAMPAEQGTEQTVVEIGVASFGGRAPVNSGLIGTLRFRARDGFSGTEIDLVRAVLGRAGKIEAVALSMSVVLEVSVLSSADFEGSGVVDFPDFVAFTSRFGAVRGDARYEEQYDLDRDGEIAFGDFMVFVGSFGKAVNRAPVFTEAMPVTRAMPENTSAGEPIGGPLSALDADGDSLTYRLRGDDADHFAIDASRGQLLTREGIAYDYETRQVYAVTVQVSDGSGGHASLPVTIALQDMDEPPSSPPSNVQVVSGNGALRVGWDRVADEPGKPPVSGYEVAYRRGDAEDYEIASGLADSSWTLSGLLNGHVYGVRVRAVNAEGASGWSEPVSAMPSDAPAWAFTDSTALRALDENTVAGEPIGTPVSVPGFDGLTYRLSGADAAHFAIKASNGQLLTREGILYDYERQPSYAVFVVAVDPQGSNADSIAVTIAVQDVAEPPAFPPSNFYVRPGDRSLTLHYHAVKDEPGKPPVLGYHAEIRRGEDGAWGTRKTIHLRTHTTVFYTTLSDVPQHADRYLVNGQVYQLRVRTFNSEGASAWSEPVSGTPVWVPPSPEKVIYHVTDPARFSDEGPAEIDLSEFTGDGGKIMVMKAALTDNIEADVVSVFAEIARISDVPEVPSDARFALSVGSSIFDIYLKAHLADGDAVPIGDGLSAPVEVCLPLPADTSNPVIVHYQNEAWHMLETASVDETAICALAAAFSFFGVGEVTVLEPPGVPAAPMVIGASLTSLTVRWTAPANTIPAITDYDVQYRVDNSGAFTEWPHDGTQTTTTITGLTPGTAYDVQVRASNAEGTSAWSASGVGMTSPPPPPTNQPPMAEGEIPALTLTVGGLSASVDVSDAFSDPDNDALVYEAMSSAPAVAMVNVSGSVVTIHPVSAGSVQVTVTASDPDDATATQDISVTVTAANQVPTFTESNPTRSVAENTAANQNIGNPVAATDSDGGTLTYSLEGTDAGDFTIVVGTGQLQTKTGVTYDHETKSSYAVTVKVVDGQGGSATVNVTITITDVNEPPSAPAAPTISASTVSSLTVAWTAPANTGPAITDYDVQYREGSSGAFTDANYTGTQTSTTITGLTANTSYEVQVRATNDEGTGAWSASVTGMTTANQAPTFSETNPTRSVAENSAAGQNIGNPVAAMDSDGGTLAYSLEGTDAGDFTIVTKSGQLQTKTGVTYDHETKSSYAVTVKVEDSQGGSATVNVTITITDVNEAPAITGGATATVNFAENGTGTVTTVAATDPDANDSVTFSLNGGADEDKFSITTSGALSFKTAPDYETPTDTGGDNTYVVTVRASDGSLTDDQTITVTVTDVNEAPVITGGATAAVNFAENGTGTVKTMAATDPDADDSVTFSLNGGADEDKFSITGAGALSFKTAPDYETPTDTGGDNTYVVTVRASDGSLHDDQTITVTVTDVNEAPAITGGATATVNFAENGTGTVKTMAATDPDADDSVTFSLNGGADEDKFSITGAGVLTFSAAPDYENPTDVESTTPSNAAGNNEYIVVVRATDGGTPGLTDDQTITVTVTDVNEAPAITGGATAAVNFAENGTGTVKTMAATDPDADDAVTFSLNGGADASKFEITSAGALSFKTAPDYENPTDANTDSMYVVTVRATDGGTPGLTDDQTITVTVTDVTEPPSAPAAPTISASTVTSLMVAWTAPANTGPAITDYDVQYREGSSGTFNAWTHTGTATSTTITGLTANTSYEVQVRATNAEGTSAWSASVTGMTTANQAPTFSETNPTRSVAENSAAGQNIGNPVAAKDSDGGTLAYSLEGTDAASFTIVVGTGQLQTKQSVTYDHETKSSYAVTVKVEDGQGGSATVNVTITITDVTEPPSAPAAPTISASTVTSLTVAWTAPANTGPAITDYDVQYRKGSSGTFNAWTHTGTATSTTISGLTANTSYEVQVRATNDEGTGEWSASVTGMTTANVAPTFSETNPTRSVAENSAAGQNIGNPVAATDSDGGTLAYSLEGTDAGDFTIVTKSGQLQTKQSVTYDHETKASYAVTVKVVDGQGGSATVNVTINVTDVNEAPAITGGATAAVNFAENGTGTVTTVAATDPDTDDSVTFSLNGGADASKFEITSAGALSFKTAPDYENPTDANTDSMYVVTVRATDGGMPGLTDDQTITVTVTDVNEAPAITGGATATVNFAENGTGTVTAVAATDPDADDSVTFSLNGGADASKFEITSAGALSFKTAPDYETPTDTGGDNTYVVTVRASDGSLHDDQTITVTVTDVNEAPAITGGATATVNFAENGTGTVKTMAATDPDADDSVTFSLNGGADEDKFSITGAGVLTFSAAPDYENPTDVESTTPSNAAGNNEYIVVVRATDGGTPGLTDDQTITVTVTDVTEPPLAPAAPTISASTVTSLTVAWTAPANTGPAITDYDVQYREGSSGTFNAWTHTGTATSTTITGLTANTSYEVQVRATNDEGTGEWSASVTGMTTANQAPTFSETNPTRSVAENSAAGQNIGNPVTAMDSDGGTLTYSLEGTDKDAFTIVTKSGQLQTKTGVTYDHETKASYAVTVKVVDGQGGSATVNVTINVTDVNEAPLAPAAPTISASTVTSLTVAWTAPANTGPAITDYDVQYSEGNSGAFTDANYTGTQTSTTITGLTANTSYEVQVRATNDEGTGEWSASVTGMTTANVSPTFSETNPTRSVAENTAAGQNIGNPVAATDSDGGTLAYSLEGTDAGDFTIVTKSGQLQTKTGATYDHETKSSYAVTVKVVDGQGGSATVNVTINVTDVNEAPAITGGATATVNFAENGTGTVTAVAATDPDADDSVTFSLNGGADEDKFSITGAGVLTFSAAPDFENPTDVESTSPSNAAGNNAYIVVVRATDGGPPGLTDDQTITVTVTDVNEAPAITGGATATVNFAENGTGTVTTVAVTDPDADDAVTFSLNGGADEDKFSITTSGALSFKTAPDYENPTDTGGDNTYVVTVRASDGSLHDDQTITVTVTDVTEPPSAPAAPTISASTVTSLMVAWTAPANTGPAITDYDVQYREGSSGTFNAWTHTGTATSTTITGLTANTSYEVQVRATNAEGTSAWSASVTGMTTANQAPTFSETNPTRSVAENSAAGQNIGNPVTAMDSDGGTLTYSLEGTDKDAFTIVTKSGQLQTKQSVTYDHETKSSYAVTVKVVDGQGGSATVNVTITITDVTEPPSAPAAPTISASTVTSLTVAWTAPVNTGPAITDYDVQYREGNSGAFTDANYTGTQTSTTITGLTANTSYEVQVRATNDEGTGEWSASITGMTTANQAPTFSETNPTRSVAENSAAGQNIGNPVTAMDSDGGTLAYSLEGTDAGDFTIVTKSGQLQTKTGVTYDHETKSSYAVTVKVEDSQGGSATVNVTITITDVNEAPAITGGATAAVNFAENGTGTVKTMAATDPDADDAVTFSLNGGADEDKFSITGAGALSFKTAPDYENPTDVESTTPSNAAGNNEYIVVVRATDGGPPGLTDDQTITVTVTDVNEAPAITGGATAAVNFAENGTGTVTTVAVTDPDADDAVTFSLNGGADEDKFSITTSGALSFKTAPDYENPTDTGGDNTYVVTVRASDGSLTDDQTITVTVTDVTEPPSAPAAPTISASTVTSLTVAWTAPVNTGPAITDYDVQYREGSSGTFNAWTHTGTATSTTISGLTANTSYEVQVRATNAEGTSAWSASVTGMTTANQAPTFSETNPTRSVAENTAANQNIGNPVAAKDSDGGTLAHSLEGTDAGDFTIVTKSGQLQTKQSVTYDHETKSSYAVTVKVVDGQGGSATVNVTINVTDVTEPPAAPDAPTISASTVTSLTVAWTAPVNTGPAITDYDVQYREGSSGTFNAWTHTGTATSTTITGLTANTSYEVQVRATNDEGTGEWSASVTGMTTANQAPTFSETNPTRSVAENTAANQNIGNPVAAMDSDGGTLAYSLEGTDAGDFTIVTKSGQLQTKTGATYDHETKSSYAVTVKVVDGQGGSATVNVTINVTDVNEAPAITGGATAAVNFAENGTGTVTAVAVTDPDADDSVTFSLNGGADEDKFSITGAGALSFKTAPDYETPTDTGGDNTYVVTVRASDGSLHDDQTITVTVTDVNEAPAITGGATATVNFAENGTGTVKTMAATDPDADDSVTFSLNGGADEDKFSITGAGVLTFSAAPDYENPTDVESTTPSNAAGNNEYIVVVRATDGDTPGLTDDQTVTVTVTDVTEPPLAPAAPTISASTVTSLTVAWTAPVNTGPAITDYDVQYRAGNSGAFTDANYTGTQTSTTITGLTAGTAYDVQVRATNAEGTSAWSASITGMTTANQAPTFSETNPTRSVAENTAAGQNIGNPVAAKDSDGGTLSYSLEGTDAGDFTIVTKSGQLQTKTGVTYDHETKSSYAVTVKVEDGQGGSATVNVTINVTDVTEPPSAPAAPTISASTVTSLTVAWTAPANTGPAITDYDVQYREGSSGAFTDANYTGTQTSTTISGLTANTSYEVQVRATNDEGTGEWSASVTGMTTANQAPTFSETNPTRSVAENTAAGQNIGNPVAAMDSDGGTLTYSLEGTDAGDFTIVTKSGQLQTKQSVTYDHETKSSYAVTVKVVDGQGGSATVNVTITITDVNEAPAITGGATAAVNFAENGTGTVKTMAATDPDADDSVTFSLNGGADEDKFSITGAGVLTFSAAPDFENPTDIESTTPSNAAGNNEYIVVVRATDGGPPGLTDDQTVTVTVTDVNEAPVITGGATATVNFAENGTGTVKTMAVTDPDADDSVTFSLNGGADASKFEITSAGALSFKTAPDYENPTDVESTSPSNAAGNNAYIVVVQATDGGTPGLTDDQTITVTVTDVNEPPLAPAAPTISASTVTSLTVAWTAPVNTGPAITDYDVQYRAGSSGTFNAWTHTGTATSTTISGLTANTSYDVQVRATNAEGTSAWSAPITGMTLAAGICARTSEVQTAILSELSGISDCALVTETHLSSITGTLDFRAQSITDLKANDFAGLSGLGILRLDNNSLSSLPAGVFSGLSRLRTLRLNRNALSSLPADVFSDLSNLERLTLDNNSLSSLPTGVFSGLSDLERLRLDNNSLSSLPTGVFSGLSGGGLTELKLSGNPGSDFTLTLQLKRTDNTDLTATDPATVKVWVAEGAPFDMTVSLSATGGTLSAAEATISAGSIESDAITVTPSGNSLVTVSLGSAPSVPINYEGLSTAVGGSLQLLTGICARTSEVQTAILSELSGISDCALVTEMHLSSITGTLDFRAQSITDLKANDFAGLSVLGILRLDNNSLSSLPAGVFSGLSRLRALRLNRNALSSLPADVFSDLSDLERLTLDNNELTALPDSIFFGLSSLTRLYLSGNPGSDFTLTLQLKRTDNTDLTATDPATVKVWVAEGAPFDMTVSLSATGGTLSAAEATISAGSIESDAITVTPSGNSLVTVSLGSAPSVPINYEGLSTAVGGSLQLLTGICARTSEVQTAILSELSGISDCALVTETHLSSITGTLDIHDQSIAALQANDFSGLSGLQTLSLYRNALTSLPAGVFTGLSNLQILHLDDNNLNALPADVFTSLSNLQTLHLNSNDLNALPAGVFNDLSNLQTLHLNDNNLDALPDQVFTSLSNLQTLRLDANELDALPAGVFNNLSNLRTLSLTHNDSLTALPTGVFTGLSNLQTLSLTHNDSLTTLSTGVFNDLSNLQTLSLTHNDSLTALPTGVFNDLSNLQGLWLDDNSLRELPASAFSDLSSLRILNLGDNELTALPDSAFFDLSSLQTLYLDNNELTALPDSMFFGLSSLTRLDLSGNTGSNFTLTLQLKRTDNTDLTATEPATVKVWVAEGAPFDMTVSLSATGGTLSAAEATISAGSIESDAITVTQIGSEPATVNLVGAAPHVPINYEGLSTVRGNAIVLFGVRENRAPQAEGSIDAVTLKEGDTAEMVDVSSKFSDPDNDDLIYTAMTSNNAIATVAVNGSVVTISPVAAGITTITVMASDGTLSAHQEIAVTVQNAAPTVNEGLTAQTAALNTAFTYTFSENAFQDTDVDALTYTSSGLPAWLTFTPSTRTFSGMPPDTEGSPFDITVTANDGNGGRVQATFTLTVPIGICGRTTNIQTAILSVISVIDGVNTCNQVTDAHLAAITDSLILRSQSITALQANDFSGMSSLRILNFYDNDLTALPTGVFDNLSSLRFLSLYSNSLTALPTGVFDDLSRLRFLSLDDNDLTALPTGVFNDLSNLQTLSLTHNDLNALPAGVFNDLSNLQTLSLTHNDLNALPAGVFNDLSNLQGLWLDDNSLRELPASAFSDLSSLRILNLGDNKLTALPDSMFFGLSSLTRLDLSGNTGSNFTLTLQLKRTDNTDLTATEPATVKVWVAEGAPFDMTVSLSATGGTLSAAEATISAGSIESDAITVTQIGSEPATVSLGSAPSVPINYEGISTAVGNSLELF